jgi:hypothetical protein
MTNHLKETRGFELKHNDARGSARTCPGSRPATSTRASTARRARCASR